VKDDVTTDSSDSLDFFFSFLNKLWGFSVYTQKNHMAWQKTVRGRTRTFVLGMSSTSKCVEKTCYFNSTVLFMLHCG
jgi:hypothetical protein